jgi:hypothetical protein
VLRAACQITRLQYIATLDVHGSSAAATCTSASPASAARIAH